MHLQARGAGECRIQVAPVLDQVLGGICRRLCIMSDVGKGPAAGQAFELTTACRRTCQSLSLVTSARQAPPGKYVRPMRMAHRDVWNRVANTSDTPRCNAWTAKAWGRGNVGRTIVRREDTARRNVGSRPHHARGRKVHRS